MISRAIWNLEICASAYLHQIARAIKTIKKFLIVIDYHQPDLTTNNIHGKITQF